MDREAYRNGIRHLKTRIKELAAHQKSCKQVMRLPRKTDEDHKRLQAEINKVKAPNERYSYDVTWVQMEAAARRLTISAYLNVYAEVRGKPLCHTPTRGGTSLPCGVARKEFEKACGTTADLSLLPWTAGKLTCPG